MSAALTELYGRRWAADLHGRDRADHHDGAGPGFLQVGHGGLAAAHGGKDVHIHRLAPAGRVVARAHGAGDVGDKDIQTAQAGGHAIDEGGQAVGVSNIEGLARRPDAPGLEGRNRVGHLVLRPRADGHVGALLHQQIGNGPSDAARAAGDDGLPAFQAQIHGRCSPLNARQRAPSARRRQGRRPVTFAPCRQANARAPSRRRPNGTMNPRG